MPRSFVPQAASPRWRLPLMCATLAVLSACGGGGSTTATPTPVDPLAPAVQSDLDKAAALYGIDPSGVGGDGGGDGGAAGAAGDGAPLKRAVVTLTDAKGNQVSGMTDNNGKYLLKYQTKNFTAPLVLRVIDAGGNMLTSVTDESATTGKAIRASINPLTDKITSDVIPATVSGTDKVFDGSKVDLTKLAKAKTDLVSSINAALGTAGVASTSQFDPVKSIYAYDGTGVDTVIESISHARDSGTGATQLRAKFAGLQTNSDGTIAPTFITASTPLATTSVALSSNPGLTFGKLDAWVSESNRCLGLSVAQRNADTQCADGARRVAPNFKNSSRDWEETYVALFSEADRSGIQGSSLRNPQVLFTTRSTGSTIDDVAVVEVTVNQPRTGPLSGNVAAPVEYTATIVFRRDDSLTKAAATNWWAYGNQRNFDISFRPRFVSNVQVNPLKQANSTGNVPSNISSAINFSINPAKFDVATRTYVSANLRAVRVTGPGLPTAGVVFAPSSASGATSFLAVHNKTGVVDTSTMSVNSTSNNFTLGAVASDGSSLYSGFWNAANVGNLDAPLTDYSALQAYSAYQFEYFLNSNPGNTTPDAIETARILAPVMSPSAVRSIPLNDFSPSQSLVTAPAAGGCSFTLNWSNNANASPVSNVFIYGQTNTAAGLSRYLITSNVNASLVGTRPSSSSLTAANCATGAIPALSATAGSSDFRQIGLGMTQARYQYYTYMQWNN